MLEFKLSGIKINGKKESYNIRLIGKRCILFHDLDNFLAVNNSELFGFIGNCDNIETSVNVFLYTHRGERLRVGHCTQDTDITVLIKPHHINMDFCKYTEEEYILFSVSCLEYDTIEEIIDFRIVSFDKNYVMHEFDYKNSIESIIERNKYTDFALKGIESVLNEYSISLKDDSDLYRYVWLFAIFAFKSERFRDNNKDFILRLMYYALVINIDSFVRVLGRGFCSKIRGLICLENRGYSDIKDILALCCRVCVEPYYYEKEYEKDSDICIRIEDKYILLCGGLNSFIHVDWVRRYCNSFLIHIEDDEFFSSDTDYLYINLDTGVVLDVLNSFEYNIFNSNIEFKKHLILK